MARKKPAKPSLISRLRARLKRSQQQLKAKQKPMAYGRNSWKPRFRNPFRSNRGNSFRRPQQRRSGGGGFSRRMPIVGIRIPNILIWAAIIGGGLFLGKDFIKPLIERMKNKI